MTLSVVIITLNEEANIARCLESVKWADEIIVVDSYSTDRTVEIARHYTDKVFLQEWLGFSGQRNFALSKATGKWVFLIDADEEVSPELRKSIRDAISSGDSEIVCYEVQLQHCFMNRFLRSFQERKQRLFLNGKVQYSGKVHERPEFVGRVGALHGTLRHYAFEDLESYNAKLEKYSTLSAKERFERGRKCGYWDLFLRPVIDFLKFYVLKGGVFDGIPGLVFAGVHAHYTLMKYAKLYWLKQTKGNG